MKTLVALVYIAFANVVLLGQTLSPYEPHKHMKDSVVDGLKRLPKNFPPDLIVSTKDPSAVTPTRSYCVYYDLAAKSLSVKACRTSPLKCRLWLGGIGMKPRSRPESYPSTAQSGA
jgi:hypothetical protein